MQDVFIGVDVSKDTLDIAGSPGKAHLSIVNGQCEIRRWLKSLPPGACVAMESTGRYHQLLAKLARAAELHVYVLNPKRIWHAARGDGRRSKTDRIDAQVIAKFLQDHIADLHEWCPGTGLQSEILVFERRHQCLERHCSAMLSSMQDVDGLDDELEQFKQSIKSMLQAVELRIQLLVAQDDEMAHKSALLTSVPAIGQRSAASLAALFGRLPFTRSDSVVAFIGIDVRASDSGTHRGRRRLTKIGPAYLRKQVWLMGFVATHTKVYKPFYEALRARGLDFTEAAMILGRRILRIAWAVWRTDKPFDPHLVGKRA
ncbi:MAG: IS110 family transposase [Pseudomonadota bacterium]|nr:IS110 family transposase [Pseudomonadota bacterium]